MLSQLMTDFDECDTYSSCDENAECKNTIGSYECQCKDGFRGNGLICQGKCWPNYIISVGIMLVSKL